MRLVLAVLTVWSSVLGGQPTAPAVRLVQELRLDATAEDFPSVGRVFVGPRGQIAIPISVDQQVRVYDSTGRLLGKVGRRGSGPGEFRNAGFVSWVGDTLWASDGTQQRVSYFGPDLKHVRTELWPSGGRVPEGPVMSFAPIAIHADGSMLGTPFVAGGGANATIVAVRQRDDSLRVVARLPYRTVRPLEVEGVQIAVPFAPQPVRSYARDGSRIVELVSMTADSRDGYATLRVLDSSGDTIVRSDLPYRGLAVTQRSIDSAVAVVVPRPDHLINMPVDFVEQFQEQARKRIPHWRTPYESVLAGLDRTIWIGLLPMGTTRSYLILNGRGDPVGSLTVPLSTRVRQASATHVWVTETDDDGLSSVVRYRVVGLNCGPPGC